MKKLSRLTFLFAAVILLAQVFLPTLSYAFLYTSNYTSESKENLSMQLERPDVYKIGDQYVIKIKGENGTAAYYCLRGGLGFGNIQNEEDVTNTSIPYSFITDLINKDTVISKLTYLDENSYNAICWIADNMYVQNEVNSNEAKAKLLENAGISSSVLTNDDIEAVEQIALWYFTNADKANELISSFVVPLANNPDDDALASTYLTINDNHLDNTQQNRKTQINKLYRYLIEHAQLENYMLGDNVQLPTLTLEKENLTPTIEETIIQGLNCYLVGPFKVNKTQGNIDFTANFTCKINEEATTRNFETQNISPVALVAENGTVLTNEQAIAAEEFYVRILNTVLNIDEVNSFKLDLSYSYNYTKTIATVWTAGEEDQPVLKVEKEIIEDSKADTVEVTTLPKEFDLSLRKFISNIKRNGENVELESREPEVDTSTLKTGRTNEKGELEYTATYTHPKNELTLHRGDVITYTIRIYNEGEIAGTATEVTDYLPEGLLFLGDNQTNQKYGWTAEGQTIKTTYLMDKNIVIPAYSPDGRDESTGEVHWQQSKNGSDGLYYVDLPIVCQISDTVEAGRSLRNIAEITNDDGDDRDSTPGNVDRDNYTPGNDNSTYQEDDDDYERVKVEEFFDLALRKYIASVKTGGETTTFEDEGTRNPNEDASNLNTGNITTADYKHQKDPVLVETGSLVNYKLVIYNEADVSGRATKVIDQLPEGLKFVKVVSGNFESDGTYSEETNTLTLVRMERNEDNLAPFNGSTLASETIEIQCEVTAEPDAENNKILTNIAWIAEYYNDKGLEDRDSDGNTPNMPGNLVTEDTGYINEEKNSGKDLENPESYFEGQQDDDDFEKIILKPIIGLYDIVLVKEDAEGEQLNDTATFEVDGVEKQVTGKLTIVKDKKITSANVEMVDTYIIKETVPPDKYCAFDGVIKIEVYKKKDGKKYVVDSIKYYVDNVEVTENRKDLDVYLNTDGNIYVEVKDYQFDLALRKYISAIERNGKAVEFDSREPKLDTSTLETGTTAIYIHPKDALTVKHGDIITYRLRIYNEGEIDGYATGITDYLPSGLGFINDENVNPNWLITSPAENLEPEPLIINGKEVVRSKEGKLLELTNSTLKDSLIKKYGAEAEDEDLWQQSENDENDGLFYQEIEITCIVLAENTYEGTLKNIAEISEDKAINDNGEEVEVEDRDSEVENIWEDEEHKPGKEENGYTPGEQDDDDFEPVNLKYFDLALRKFITGVNDEEVTSRIPEFTGEIDEYGNYIYNHPKDPVYVVDKDIVTYTIRVFNEGRIAGYAEEIEDDIPEGLIFLPENDLNKDYRWQMYRPAEEDEEIAEEDKLERNNKIYVKTDDVKKATIIRTDYLSEAQGTINEETGENSNLLKAFNKVEMTLPDFRDVKVAFKVSQTDIPEENTDRIIINKAHITKDSDDDEDSTPDKWNEHEDDQDIEKIYVKEFDLALYKWVTKTIVTVDGKTTETETGFKANVGHTEGIGDNYRENSEPEPIAAVTIDKKKLNKTVVKFEYNIKVVNEGDIEGYATELTDYIPDGLEFKAEDNPLWTLGEKEGTIKTRALEGVLLEPGKSATIPVVFTWKNNANNLGLKKNVAAITEDYNDKGVEDIDSTPGNETRPDYDKEQEDDDDFALVILELKTGTEVTYIGLVLTIIIILAVGTITIKKYVL